MDVINVSNGQNCKLCCKADVCKYSPDVIEEVIKLKHQLENVELPLHVRISCQMFQSGPTTREGVIV